MGAELDFANNWAKSASAKARSKVRSHAWRGCHSRGIQVPSRIAGWHLFAVRCFFRLVDRVGLRVRISELDRGVEGINHFLNGGRCSIQDRRVSVTDLIHVGQNTSPLGVMGGLGVRCRGHKNV